jgi:hypothetical protein
MSAINTNALNVNYPTPGTNNSTQGFRDNFATIKNNLETTKTELNDLQNKVLLKSALSNSTLDNDMSNGLISNALTKGFRSTTFNLGSNLPAEVTVDVSKGDLQYGTITQDTMISFAGWAPTGTQSKVQLNLDIANVSASVFFPDSSYNSSAILTNGPSISIRLLENYGSNATPGTNIVHSNQVTIPAGVNQLQYTISTINCGTTIDVYPLNRNRLTSRIELRTMYTIQALGGDYYKVPTGQKGQPGDSAGAICTDGSFVYICVAPYDGSSNIWGSIGGGIYGLSNVGPLT